ncbi:hypothetical protein [Pedobacter nototheniae]|uniref:hypothetical protein n=1 Tax=Pedobacter nototheniae TaxID=2488994 RepID=UPI00292CE30F|nr:hypothetical protein [Pedobacter nototheniae]
MNKLNQEIIKLWSEYNPVMGYTSGYTKVLNTLFFETAEASMEMRKKISALMLRLNEISDENLQATAKAVLTSIKTQIEMARPSGAGPSGTGMGGVYAAADGVFYLVLKEDYKAAFVEQYLDTVKSMVEFETRKWQGQDFTILVRKECLDTVVYMNGTLASLQKLRPDLETKITAIQSVLAIYKSLFIVKGLESSDFDAYWKIFKEWDHIYGAQPTNGYPASLQNYYQLNQTKTEIETIAYGWLELELPVTIDIAERIKNLDFMTNQKNLQEIWDAVSQKYAVDFGKEMNTIVNACKAYGEKYIIASNASDRIDFTATPDYLVNLVTGGEDFAVNYLNRATAYSQLYLTAAKNTSLLTMINILVHEASHGYNFVLSAKKAEELLNLNSSLQVPMTEGMAFYREYQYWAAAQNLLYKDKLNVVESNYLALYGNSRKDQVEGVLCAQLETYIWRIIRYIRALCDTKVNGGEMTYTDFIEWAAQKTGLSAETLHGECFTFLASPGYAPCYAMGGATYAMVQKEGIMNNVSEIDFNTYCSAQGFYAWPVAVELMNKFIAQ